MSWTDEKVDLLKQLWAEGRTCSYIADRIGGVSRNAVIGKVHRIGLAGRIVKSTDKTKVRMGGPKPPKKMKVKPAPERGQKAILAELPVEPLPAEDIPPEKLVAFADLEESHCRWIYGDTRSGTHGFCGANKVIGLSYCERHARRAFAAPTPSKRKEHDCEVYAKHHINKVFA